MGIAREKTLHRQYNAPDVRRELRLKGYFDPYPAVTPKLLEELPQPIIISQKIIQNKRQFEVHIWSGLLSEDVPVWIESAIFRYARKYIRTFLKKPDSALEEARQEDGVETIFTLFKERQQKRATQTSLFDFHAPNIRQKQTESKSSSDAPLFTIWNRLAEQFFPGLEVLDEYVILWADRNQRSCLASCNVERKRVEVAKALDHPSCYGILEPLIYHEMCHAALGPPPVVNGRRIMHGKDFKRLEKRHPLIPTLDQWIDQGGWHQAVRRHHRAKRI